MTVVLVALLGGLVFLYRLNKKENRALAAMHYWCDMGILFHELRDDPFMTTTKWKEWLPLFEDADKRFIETHLYIKKLTRYADLVGREISDSPYQEVGSS